MLEDALAAQATHRILAHRRGGIGLPRAATGRRDKAIDVARREGHDSAAGELAADEGGQMRIHRPGERLLTGRPKLHPGQVKHVGGVRQTLQRLLIQQVAANGFYAMPLQLGLEARPWKSAPLR